MSDRYNDIPSNYYVPVTIDDAQARIDSQDEWIADKEARLGAAITLELEGKVAQYTQEIAECQEVRGLYVVALAELQAPPAPAEEEAPAETPAPEQVIDPDEAAIDALLAGTTTEETYE